MSAVETNAFLLSRIYGQGWKAAKKSLADGGAESAAGALARNPYRDVEQRARWVKGLVSLSRASTSQSPSSRK